MRTLDGKYSERVQLPAKAGVGCKFNGTAVALVLIDQSCSFMNLRIRYVHWIAASLPNCEIGFFVANTWQQMLHCLLEV